MKRFTLKIWLLASLLVCLPFLVEAVGINQSGIDLTASTIQVDYTMSLPDNHGSLQCFDTSTAIVANQASVARSLNESSVNALLSGDQIDISIIAGGGTNCFQQAGTYDVTINLVDYIGNSASQMFSLTVKAQEAGNSSTVVQTDCGDAFANNYDACELTATLRDPFNNVLHGLGGAVIKVRASQDADPWTNIPLNCTEISGSGNDCDTDMNLATSFFDAVRVKENSTYEEVFTPGDSDFHEYTLTGAGTLGLDFRSMAPTVADNQQGWQDEVIRLYPLAIEGPALDSTGSMTGPTVPMLLVEYAPLQFKTPVQLNINVDVGHKPSGGNMVMLDDMNEYENLNNRPTDRYLVPCSAQRGSTFDIDTYAGEDLDSDGNTDLEFLWYETGTAITADLEVCPSFGLFDYGYQGSSYSNEGQYAEVRLLQNNNVRSVANLTSGCGDANRVCLYNTGTTDADGVPTALNLWGKIHRTDTISFNNNNPDGGTTNNLDDPTNSTQIFIADTDYNDAPLYPVSGLAFFAANTVDGSSVDDFITESTFDMGTKEDLKDQNSAGNYAYRWRYFDEDEDPEFQLKTIVRYRFDDGASTAIPVSYYAGEYGFGSDSCEEAIFRYSADCSSYAANDPSYDILVTGDIVGEFLTYTDSTNLTDIGNVQTGGDLREQITKNAFVLSREIPTAYFDAADVAYTDAQETAFANKFSSSGVYVVENGDLKLGSMGETFKLPSGKNTVIVKDGNVIIDSDLAYGNDDDSFGFIVLCTNPEPYPEDCGNILLKPTVQRVVGTIFGDGGLMTSNGDAVIGTVVNDDDYDNQLVIQGALFTRNTIGGSQNNQSYFTPWEDFDAFSQNIKYGPLFSSRYDLRMVRPPDPNIVPAVGELRQNSVIIENDIGRTTQLTPPGFEVFGSVGR